MGARRREHRRRFDRNGKLEKNTGSNLICNDVRYVLARFLISLKGGIKHLQTKKEADVSSVSEHDGFNRWELEIRSHKIRSMSEI